MKLVVLTTALLMCAVLATTITAAPSGERGKNFSFYTLPHHAHSTSHDVMHNYMLQDRYNSVSAPPLLSLQFASVNQVCVVHCMNMFLYIHIHSHSSLHSLPPSLDLSHVLAVATIRHTVYSVPNNNLPP